MSVLLCLGFQDGRNIRNWLQYWIEILFQNGSQQIMLLKLFMGLIQFLSLNGLFWGRLQWILPVLTWIYLQWRFWSVLTCFDRFARRLLHWITYLLISIPNDYLVQVQSLLLLRLNLRHIGHDERDFGWDAKHISHRLLLNILLPSVDHDYFMVLNCNLSFFFH